MRSPSWAACDASHGVAYIRPGPTWSTRLDPAHSPQSSTQLMQVSSASQVPSPHAGGGHSPQSLAQLAHVSPASQLPLPQVVCGHMPQSVGQLVQFSPALQVPSPQRALHSPPSQAVPPPPPPPPSTSPPQPTRKTASIATHGMRVRARALLLRGRIVAWDTANSRPVATLEPTQTRFTKGVYRVGIARASVSVVSTDADR